MLDPGFSAILARACLDLARLPSELGEERIADESGVAGERVAAALRARADTDGLIRAVDLVDGSPLAAVGAGSALAALTPGLAAGHVRALARELVDGRLASRYGVRTLARDDPERSARNYWRGPLWANVTWLCAHGLEARGEHSAAGTLRRRMLDAIDGDGMREYFVPDSGRGLGTHDFTWTAALGLRVACAQATTTAGTAT